MAPGDVVVVEPPAGAVVLVVELGGVDVVVVVEDAVVVVVVVDDVVVVAAGGGVLFSVVPLPALPKMDAKGLPEMSSTAVMNISASTNTMAAVPAMVGQEYRRTGRRAGRIGVVVASRRSVAGASAAAEISRRCVSPTGAPVDCISTVSAPAPAVGSAPAGDAASPLAPVAPSLRRSVDDSGARTTTCLTASWPRSMDWATSAVPRVATADPMATPMIVPLTPKTDAMIAAITAPAAEARIWRNENFTQGYLVAPGHHGGAGGGPGTRRRDLLHAVGAHSPTAPSTCSRKRSACPLWRAYSSIMWIMIHRSEKVDFSVDTDGSSRLPAASTMERESSHWRWKSSMSAAAFSGSRSLKSASRSSTVENGSGDELPRKMRSNHHHSTRAMCRTRPRRLSPDGGMPRRARSAPSRPSHFHSSVERW